MTFNFKILCNIVLFLNAMTVFGQTYYVSKTGSNSYNATQAQNPATPWLTIQKAADNILGGATVLIGAGTYSEKVTIASTKSGTAAQRTVFKNAPNALVIVDGGVTNTNAAVTNGTNTNRFQTQFLINGASYVTIKGIKVQNAQWYGFSADVNAHYAIIDSCYTFNTGASGIYMRSSNNIEVTRNNIQKACQITTRGAGGSGTQECISVVSVDNFKVNYNEVFNSTVPDDAGGEGIDIKGGSKYGEVKYNYVHDILPLGIYIDAGSYGSGLPCYSGGTLPALQDIRIFGNKVVSTNGVAVAGELGGEAKNIYFYNNIIKNSIKIGFVFNIPGDSLVCAGNTPNPIPKQVVGKFTNIYITNNVFYDNTLADITSNTQNPANSNLVIRNNIFYNKGVTATFIRTFRFDLFTPFTVSHNCYYDFKASAQSVTLNANDVNLLNPLFVDAANNNFALQSSASPAVNKGIPIYMPSAPTTLMYSTDYYNAPRGTVNWDMGIHEVQTPLPITLSSFRGYHENGENHLHWTTENEIGNALFEMERSKNGIYFEKWQSVLPKSNNSITSQMYSLVDKNPINRLMYYRIKQIDTDNRFSYSNIVQIQGETDLKKPMVYPNPANDFLMAMQLDFDVALEIFDALGKKIYTETTSEETKIDIQSFAKGVYFLKIIKKDNTTSVLKFIKN
jgi:Secretion system C-terminal sorting domain/Right handed beta helix region